MISKNKLAALVIAALLLAVFAMPYFYNKFVHAPAHSIEEKSSV